MNRFVWFFLMAGSGLLSAPDRAEQAPNAVTMALGPLQDRTGLWEQVGGDLLCNFNNMYNLDIVHDPGDAAYPFKGWFFGWAAEATNPGFPGCDAIFAGRAPHPQGPWEVYTGDTDGVPGWDRTMDPRLWVPVIAGTDRYFDSWHNGDPSVVRVGDRYCMAYSATGKNEDGIHFGHPGDRDGDIITVAGATSADGLHWKRMDAPILVDRSSIGAPTVGEGHYAHPYGNYHRPSLMWEAGVFRLWLDGFEYGSPISMLYAENRGDFRDPEDWTIVRGLDRPLIREWPNPDVVKVKDVYFCFSDPGYYGELYGEGWVRRQTASAVSLNGLDWVVLGHIRPDADVQANHVPEGFVLEEEGRTWLYVNYGAQTRGDYRYERIRMKRREVTEAELERYRRLLGPEQR